MATKPRESHDSADPHADQHLLHAGPELATAKAVILLLHGRGATAESMVPLYTELELPTIAALAPQAADSTWYPFSFLAPIDTNQPSLDSALRRVENIVRGLIDQGIVSDRIAILGFSQGGCLATEYVARHPRHYGAVIAFTGGLIGPPGTPRNYNGSLAGASVFLGTSDPDPHVPLERVKETAVVLKRMGANVDMRSYPGMGHTINEEEIEVARQLLQLIIAHDGESRG